MFVGSLSCEYSSTGFGVGDGVEGGVGVAVRVGIGDGDAADVGAGVGEDVGVGIGVGDAVDVGACVGEDVGVGLMGYVGIGVRADVGIGDGVGVRVEEGAGEFGIVEKKGPIFKPIKTEKKQEIANNIINAKASPFFISRSSLSFYTIMACFSSF